jgi:predicted nucleic acid-binding protein
MESSEVSGWLPDVNVWLALCSDILTPQDAICVYRELRSDERVRSAHEPPDLERLWFSLMAIPSANGGVWTDAWLAAFALTHGSRLVSFDAGMRRWAELQPEVLGR